MAEMAAENLLAGLHGEPLPNSAFEKTVEQHTDDRYPGDGR